MFKSRLFVILALWMGLLALSPETPSFAEPAELSQSSLQVIENIGQFDARARFLIETNGLTLWLTDDGLWITLPDRSHLPTRLNVLDPTGHGADSPSVDRTLRGIGLHLTFPGSRPNLEPFGRQDTVVSYFTPLGQFPGVPVWSGVRYANMYPGLNLEISEQNNQLVMQFVRTSDATNDISLHVEGPNSLRMENAIPILSTPLGEIPLPFQSESNLTIHATVEDNTSSFNVLSSISPPSFLSFAPTSLVYSTYLGGNMDDTPNTLAVNAQGEILVAGETFSPSFPSGPGLNIPTHLIAAFITKLNSTGTAIVYNINLVSTGQLDETIIKDMVIDVTGNAYVAGYTDYAGFPTTPGAYDTVPPAAVGLYKAFVMKFGPNGGAPIYSTLLGTNSEDDIGNGIAVDNAGNAYITGYTESVSFPTMPGAYDTTLGGTRDVFVTKFNPTGTALVYSTLIGGSSKDNGERISLDGSNNVVVSGYSEDGPTYPQTVPPIGPVGTWDIVVSKLNTGGTGLIYSTIIGGSSFDFYAQGLALDASGNAYISGETFSNNFPTTPGVFDTTLSGTVDPVVFKLNVAGTAVSYSTYLGGSSAGALEFIYDLALDSANQPYVVGYTDSADFPTTAGAHDRILSGPLDIFVAKVNGIGTGLDYASFLGGSLEEYGTAIAVKAPNEFVLVGSTYSADFPTTPNAYDSIPNGGGDGFVARFNPLPFNLFLPVVIK